MEVPVTPKVPPTVAFPDALKVVKEPVEEELEPIAVPSIAPPFISTVVLLVPTNDLRVEILDVFEDIVDV